MNERLFRSVPQAGKQSHAWFIFWHFPRLPCLLSQAVALEGKGQVKEAVVWRSKAGANCVLSFAAGGRT